MDASDAMDLDGSYESKLLRIIIGFLHVSLSEQRAQTLYGKHFHNLTTEERAALQTQMVQDVVVLASQLTEEAMHNFLKPPAPPGPPGKIH